MSNEEKLIIAKLTELARKHGMSLMTATANAGLPRETVSAWLKYTAVPTADEIKKIEDLFGEKLDVSMNTPKPSVKSQTVKPTEKPKTEKKEEKPKKDVLSDALSTAVSEKTQKAEDKTTEPKDDFMSKPIEEPAKNEEAPKKQDKEIKAKAPKVVRSAKAPSEASGSSLPKTKTELKGNVSEYKKAVIEALNALESYTMKIGEESMALDKKPAAPQIDPKLKPLLKAAEQASDEGIEMAVKILKKWKKGEILACMMNDMLIGERATWQEES